MPFRIYTDKHVQRQLEAISRSATVKEIIGKHLLRIHALGPRAGKLIDAHNQLYESKCKRPPLRIYFQVEGDSIYLLEIRMKHSSKAQNKLIDALRERIRHA